LKTIELVGRTLGLRPGSIFHRVGWTMAVTGSAQDTARAALFEVFGIEPFFDSLKSTRSLGFVFHRVTTGGEIL
jgi:hypothetical protein